MKLFFSRPSIQLFFSRPVIKLLISRAIIKLFCSQAMEKLSPIIILQQSDRIYINTIITLIPSSEPTNYLANLLVSHRYHQVWSGLSEPCVLQSARPELSLPCTIAYIKGTICTFKEHGHLLSTYLQSISIVINSFPICFICSRPHLLSPQLLSSLTCYQASLAIKTFALQFQLLSMFIWYQKLCTILISCYPNYLPSQ